MWGYEIVPTTNYAPSTGICGCRDVTACRWNYEYLPLFLIAPSRSENGGRHSFKTAGSSVSKYTAPDLRRSEHHFVIRFYLLNIS